MGLVGSTANPVGRWHEARAGITFSLRFSSVSHSRLGAGSAAGMCLHPSWNFLRCSTEPLPGSFQMRYVHQARAELFTSMQEVSSLCPQYTAWAQGHVGSWEKHQPNVEEGCGFRFSPASLSLGKLLFLIQFLVFCFFFWPCCTACGS